MPDPGEPDVRGGRQVPADPSAAMDALREMRVGFERAGRDQPLPAGLELEPDTVAGRPAEWIVPASTSGEEVLLYLHGGGYALGSLGSHQHLVAALGAATGRRALILGYRLAPEHPFPAAIDDVSAGYAALLERGHGPESVALAGDSAGGGLAVALLVRLRREGRRQPAAAVLLSPWTDLSETARWRTGQPDGDGLQPEVLAQTAEAYAAGHRLDDPLLSPALADLRGLAPLLVLAGGDELLRPDIEAFTRRARKAGVEVELATWAAAGHVFPMEELEDEAAAGAIAVAARFVRERWP